MPNGHSTQDGGRRRNCIPAGLGASRTRGQPVPTAASGSGALATMTEHAGQDTNLSQHFPHPISSIACRLRPIYGAVGKATEITEDTESSGTCWTGGPDDRRSEFGSVVRGATRRGLRQQIQKHSGGP